MAEAAKPFRLSVLSMNQQVCSHFPGLPWIFTFFEHIDMISLAFNYFLFPFREKMLFFISPGFLENFFFSYCL